jgi:hypothetical protein
MLSLILIGEICILLAILWPFVRYNAMEIIWGYVIFILVLFFVLYILIRDFHTVLILCAVILLPVIYITFCIAPILLIH